MLDDRDYMRQPAYRDPIRWPNRPSWSWTLGLVVAYAVVYIVEIIFSPSPVRLVPGNEFCYKFFALSGEGIEQGYVWQLVTYQFMHAGFFHVLLNSWAIYVFGRELESFLGARKFLALVFSSGIVGGVFQVLAAIVWPGLFGGTVVGASACAFGLIAAFAMLYPERELLMLIFFVIPVRMRAKTLLIILAVLAIAGVLFSESIFGGNVANAAHIGGMLMGIFYVRKIIQGNWFQWQSPAPRERPREFAAMPVGKGKFWRSAARPSDEEDSTDQFLQKEVDPILEKISAHGIQSLTERERQILEKARAKMAKR